MERWRAILASLGLVFWFAARVAAADVVLVRQSGDVEVLFKGKKTFSKAAPGTALSFGDRLQTLKGAKAHLLFADGNAVLIKESTSVLLAGKPGQILLHVPQGEFLIGLKKRLSRKESFRVRTPAAVAAVRGTLFWGLSDEELNSTFACLQHEIEVRAGGKTIVLKPGEKTYIPYGQAPSPKQPSGIVPDFMDTFTVDGALEGFHDLMREK